MRASLLGSAVAGVLLAGIAPAAAATATGNLGVQITIEAACTVGTVNNVNFGTVGVLGANADATGSIDVTCSNTLPYEIALGVGTGLGATESARKMTSGAETVTYGLYSDAARSQVWGQTPSSNTVAGTGNGSAQTYTVYGRVPPQTTPTAGTYMDTVVITVSY